LSEETGLKPKPMVEIGGKPILWHIMKIYSGYGFNEFIILCGYKGYLIKEYFVNYQRHNSDLTIDMMTREETHINNHSEPWKVTLIDTGLNSMTGRRIKQAKDLVGNEPFMLTYGDGVSDINIQKLVDFHLAHGKALTITSAQPEGRFGSLSIDENNRVYSFQEKPKGDGNWVNAGFFVCQPDVFDYIPDGDQASFEKEPLEILAKTGQLYTYKHSGFWKPMDTIKDKYDLEDMITSGKASWIKW
jgi:glucose-1-phosphate cytidylyltransferase